MRVGLVGDIYIDRTESSNCFSGVEDLFRDCDVLLGNQEAAISERDAPPVSKPERSLLAFRSLNRHIDALVQLPMSAVGLANNHVLDFGVECARDTRAALLGAGIATAGFGENEADSFEPAVVRVGAESMAFIAFTCVFHSGWQATPSNPGMATVDVRTWYEVPTRHQEQPGTPPIVHTGVSQRSVKILEDSIRRAREIVGETGYIVVGTHWGQSGGNTPIEYQVELTQICARLGVDVFFGHGPHVAQAVGYVGSMPIFFSLGNFLMDLDIPAFFGTYGLSAVVTLSKRGKAECRLDPIFRDGTTPRRSSKEELTAVESEIGQASIPFGAILSVKSDYLTMKSAN